MISLQAKNQLTASQTAVILTNYTLAVGILTLPRAAAQEVQTPDIWITVLLGGCVSLVAGVIHVKLSQQYPGKNFYEYSQNLVGKVLGSLLSIFVIVYFLTLSAFEARTVAEVAGFFLLDGTPTWAILMPFMAIGLYLINSGINPIARLFEIIFPLTIILFLLVIFMSVGIFELNNLRPVLGSGIMPVLKGIKTTALAFTAAEIMVVLVAFMEKPEKAIKVVLVGVGIPTLFYLITVVMVVGGLSIEVAQTYTWPTISLIQSFEITGLIFERFESFLLIIWIMQIFATFTISFYAASLGLSHLFKRETKPMIYLLIPFIYIVAMMPKNINELFKLGDILGYFAYILFGLFPLLLLIGSWVKEGRHETKQ
ncbi:spore germination protein [Halobacillus sp. A5]|uniref:spore germination protein n=1 Tax=Halobacillus sp. A5 TaxID=2880263 RepID=UPI0020A6A21B|nr:spore germination protein [Halobacillus sp. A5]MCP3028975.1 spore germination protein [Halobacillus sp. A5]